MINNYQRRSVSLVRAAHELGISDAVHEPLGGGESEWLLKIAAAVCGIAEAHAMVEASRLAARGHPEPADLVDAVAFRAAGIQDSGTWTASAMWALWVLSRLRARINVIHAARGDTALGAAVAASSALHAVLSAAAAAGLNDEAYRETCLDVARSTLAEAVQLLQNRGR